MLPRTFTMRFSFIAISMLAAWPTVGAATDATSILPIRGAQLLQRLAQPIAQLKALSSSPDGSTVLFEESFRDGHNTSRRHRSLILMNTKTGETIRLHEYRDEKLGNLSVGIIDQPVLNPQWSPDGRKIAFLENVGGLRSLAIWSTQTAGAPTRVRLDGVPAISDQRAEIYNWAWIPERNKLLISISSTAPGGKTPQKTAAQANTGFTWFKSSELRSQANRAETIRTGNITYTHFDRPLKFVSIDTRNLTSKEIDFKEPIYGAWTGISHPHLNKWTVSADRATVYFNARDTHVADRRAARDYGALYALRLRTNTIKKIYSGFAVPTFAEAGGGANIVGAVLDPALRFSKGLNPLTGASFAKLVDLTGSGARAFRVKDPVVELFYDRARLYPGARAGAIYLHSDSAPESHIYEMVPQEGVAHNISIQGLSASSVSASGDGTSLVAVFESSNSPQELYVWNTSSRKWRRLTNYAGAYNAQGIEQVERLRWKSGDNRFEVDGFIVKPANFSAAKKYPTVVLLHGGPGASYRSQFDLLQGACGLPARTLAAEGYVVLMPNMRGDRGYGLEFARAVLSRFGDDVRYDLEAGIDHLISTGLTDPEKIGVVSCSFGARQLMFALEDRPERYKAAIKIDATGLTHSVATWFYNSEHVSPNERSAVYQGLIEYYGPNPETEHRDISKIRTPMLLRWSADATFGNGDPQSNYTISFKNIPYVARHIYDSALLYTALAARDIPVEIVVDRDAHSISDVRYVLEFQSRALQWLDYFVLGKGPSPIPAMSSPIDYSEELHNR